jgi:hypothetical protein
MSLTIADIRAAYESTSDRREGIVLAARLLKPDVESEAEAELVIRLQLHTLLEKGKYASSGLLNWGARRWNSTARSVSLIQQFYMETAKGIIIGSGSSGKSYVLIGMTYLDWIRDPQWTSVKVISTTAGHARSNTFSTLVDFHNNAIIPMPGSQLEGFIGLDSTGDRRASIQALAIPQGDDGKGRLQGFHPVPRPDSHPVFGDMSRIRAILDEAEEVPEGVWVGIGNLLGSAHGIETIKVMCATNPRDVSSQLAMNAEPVGGWETIDLDRDERWNSKEKWDVLRIDAAQSENVKTGKLIYPGMMTKDGYDNYLYMNGGNSPQYYSFARGIYPPQGANDTIISGELITRSRGEFLFTGRPQQASGTDIAVDGRDKAILAYARFGMADSFRDLQGNITRFTPRFVVQLDHLQEMRKGETKIVGDDIIRFNKEMRIEPRWCGVDRTGNGASVHDYMRAVWDRDVYGLDFSSKASDKKILMEDKDTPEEEYEGVITEVWFSLRRYMEARCFGIGPGVVMEPMRRQMTGRKYIPGEGKKIRVEKKDDYKKRNRGLSPDEIDAVTILLHTIRMQGGDTPSMTEEVRREYTMVPDPSHGIVDSIKFVEI